MPELPHDQEILDLVNEKDEVVGTITHEAAFNPANLKGNFVRASDAFIMNSRGELWIPRRTATKRLKPNALDYSAAEHVMSGESYLQAMIRGFEEELNLRIQAADLTLLGMTRPAPGRPPYIEANYLYHSDEPPRYNPDDFTSYEWLQPAALLQRLKNGEIAKDNLDRAIELLLTHKAKRSGD